MYQHPRPSRDDEKCQDRKICVWLQGTLTHIYITARSLSPVPRIGDEGESYLGKGNPLYHGVCKQRAQVKSITQTVKELTRLVMPNSSSSKVFNAN